MQVKRRNALSDPFRFKLDFVKRQKGLVTLCVRNLELTNSRCEAAIFTGPLREVGIDPAWLLLAMLSFDKSLQQGPVLTLI